MRLPIADARTTWTYTLGMLRRYRGEFSLIAVLHVFAALAGLVGPWVLGRLVDDVTNGTTAERIRDLVLFAVGSVLVRTVLQKLAQERSMVFGETVFAAMREEFIDTTTGLPLSVVERAGTGDLVARTTNDVNKVQFAVRFGVPQLVVAVVTVLLTVVACLVLSPLVSVAMFVGLPIVVTVTRWYLRRANPAYQRESAAYATLNGTVTESVEGVRTVDALHLGGSRSERSDDDLAEAFAAERATLNLRTVLFPSVDMTFVLAPVAVLVWGGYLASQGTVSIGAVTAIVMFAFQIVGPVWNLIFWLDEIQVAATSLSRIIGVGLVEPDRQAGDQTPTSEAIEARGVRYAYTEGRDVLHGIDLDLRPGERVAIVGPSGAGKSTLGRMLAGIHPPTGGSVTVGGVPLVQLPLDDLRKHVALVTQEHHVFVGTIADNLRLADVEATDEQLLGALAAVDAREWVEALP